MTHPTSDAAPRPRSYQLITPEDWYRIDLDPQVRHSSIQRLVRQQVIGDDLAHIRRLLVEGLSEQSEAAETAGGIEMFVSRTIAARLPLSTSLVVRLADVLPTGAGEPLPADVLTAIADTLLEPTGDADLLIESCSIQSLPIGSAIRRASVSRVRRPDVDIGVDLDLDLQDITSFGVTWIIPVPAGAGKALCLDFSSPMIPLRPALEELCDTVARTVRWTY